MVLIKHLCVLPLNIIEVIAGFIKTYMTQVVGNNMSIISLVREHHTTLATRNSKYTIPLPGPGRLRVKSMEASSSPASVRIGTRSP